MARGAQHLSVDLASRVKALTDEIMSMEAGRPAKPSQEMEFEAENAWLRSLYAFLRQHRHELFDDAFQLELEAMYRDTGAGKDAHPPALVQGDVLIEDNVFGGGTIFRPDNVDSFIVKWFEENQ